MGTDTVLCGLKVVSDEAGRELEWFISSLPGFTVEKNASGPWDILILEVNGKSDRELGFARNALASNMTKHIFLTSPNMDPKVLIEAINMGAKGFFRQPIDLNEVRETLMKIRDEKKGAQGDEPVSRGKIITVMGSKGGVGTTTLAANIATNLAELEGPHAAAFVDANEVFGNAPLVFNIERPIDWTEVWKNITRLDATYLMTILFKHDSGVHVLPAPAMPAEDDGVARVMESLLRLMQGLFRYIIVDGGLRLDDMGRSILRLSDKVLVVTQLTLPCLINVNRLQKLFQELGYPVSDAVEVVVNRFTKKGVLSLVDAEKSLNRKIQWCIPNDYRTTMSAINESRSLTSVDRKAEVSLKVRDLARALAGKASTRPEKRGFLGLTG
ncbi:MAG: AAA family ATPase [Syntrophorhabdales bacterium]|jgi:pilus assembly protein CpaE